MCGFSLAPYNESMPTSLRPQIRRATRPSGVATPESFATLRTELPALAAGDVRVQNAFISVDPYMRGRMSAAKSYAQPYTVGEVMTGAAVGHVVESRTPDLPEGTVVLVNEG